MSSAQVLDDLLHTRRATRAYRPQSVALDTVQNILAAAARAPSNSNTQPWRVHVLTGAPLQALGADLVAAFQANTLPPRQHFPEPLPDACAAHQEDFGMRYYGALKLERDDTHARTRQTQRNFTFFGAPVGLIFTIDERLRPHSWMDLGLFVQSVMLGARARGLDTCPQVIFARFHPVIARHLRLDQHQLTVCGMSMGHADTQAAVNQLSMPRMQVRDFTRFVGFD